MDTDKSTNKDEQFKIAADNELKEIGEVLRLLADGASQKSIVSQVGHGDRWVRRVREKALKYPAYKLASLPEMVQAYLIIKKPALKSKIERYKRSISHGTTETKMQAIEMAKFKHWEELTSLAANLVSLREQYDEGHPIGGYYGYIIDDPLMIELHHGLIACLISHMKSEFKEYDTIGHWQDLLKTDTSENVITKLAFVAHRKTLEGTCPICPHEN